MWIVRCWRVFSFAVISEAVQIVLATLVLVLGASAEELLPKFCGVGFPVLLAAVPFMAVRRTRLEALAFAVAAGAMEEALSALPPVSGVSFFLAVAVLSRHFGFSGALLALVYPLYQVWLSVWLVGIGRGVFMRLLLAGPIGFLTMAAVGLAVNWLCRKAAVDEQG